jgi:hypothetical protein
MLPTETFRDATPLVERLQQVLRYPVQSGPLSTIVALAGSEAVLSFLPGLISFVLDLVVWAALFKYGFEVLRWSANGRREAPQISFTVSDTIARYAVLLLLLLEIGLLAIGSVYGRIPALVVGFGAMAAIPAIVIILALEEGMLRALNPVAWIELASRLGRSYLVFVCLFCAALVVQSVVSIPLRAHLPDFVAIFAIAFVVDYLMIGNFHFIGAMIHEHSDELGYAGHLELKDEMQAGDRGGPAIVAARTRGATGDAAGAAALLREELRAHPDVISMHVEYRHWLRESDDKVELAAHGRRFVPLLLAADQDARAVDVARESQQCDAAFALEEPDDITRVATAAASAGHAQVALALLGGFHKRFRGHADIVRNYLLAAKLLAERMNKEMPARALLQQVRLEFPDDPRISEVDAYVAFLDKLAATTPSGVRAP